MGVGHAVVEFLLAVAIAYVHFTLEREGPNRAQAGWNLGRGRHRRLMSDLGKDRLNGAMRPGLVPTGRTWPRIGRGTESLP